MNQGVAARQEIFDVEIDRLSEPSEDFDESVSEEEGDDNLIDIGEKDSLEMRHLLIGYSRSLNIPLFEESKSDGPVNRVPESFEPRIKSAKKASGVMKTVTLI